MIPRNSRSGESITHHSTIESNPAAWVEYSMLTREQRQIDALARALSVLGGTDPAARRPLVREYQRQLAERQRLEAEQLDDEQEITDATP